MEFLKENDRRRLNESIAGIRSIRRSEDLGPCLHHAVGILVESDVTAIECFDTAGRWCGRVLADPAVEVERHFPAFLREMQTHPFYPAFLSNHLWHPLRISDVTTARELRDRAIYTEFFRPLGVNRQLAVAIPSPNGSAGVLVFSRRGRDFSDLEATLLSAIIPHIERAERRAFAFSGSSSLPKVSCASAGLDSHRFCYALTQVLNVSDRQAHILWWLAHGKTDSDIAELCSISKRTVQKHLENIYGRLGVENRTAAVIRALDSGTILNV